MVDLVWVARRVLPLIDLTSLNEDDTDAAVISLCDQATTATGPVAAVCVYPRFVSIAKQALDERGERRVQVATVVNFPYGTDALEVTLRGVQAAIAEGADEIDVVFPFKSLMLADSCPGYELVRACKEVCGRRRLKVIIESGELREPTLIRTASLTSIEAGADFIKTSTGKARVNATPAAANIMLEVIRDTGGQCGFKAAGGIRTVADAATYLALADNVLGQAWVTPAHFRFGASALLTDIERVLGHDGIKVEREGY